nr:uncharacterized protein LOC129279122 [Lytechinus pictus]
MEGADAHTQNRQKEEMAANKTLLEESSIENLKLICEFATLPSRTELSDSLPLHLRDCHINDLKKEYALQHDEGGSNSEEVDSSNDALEEKSENEPSEKEVVNMDRPDTIPCTLKSHMISSPKTNARAAFCYEPFVMLGHHVMENIRTLWEKMWIPTSEDALASG